jgi:hypothetical protein
MRWRMGLVALAFLVGCGTAAEPPSGPAFIAFTSDFDGFRTWEAFPLGNEDALLDSAGNVVHPAGPRTVYLNERPPPGSREFPVGTILVKEMDDGDIASRTPLAMVKRGAGAAGPGGWEFFELQNQDAMTEARIVWRGRGPTGTTDVYGGDFNVCVTCHATAAANDYVQSEPLQLSTF